MKKRCNRKRHLWVSTTLITLFALVCPCVTEWKDACFALDGADVAIYNDSIAPADPVTGATRSGAWQDGITAITCMLTWMGLSYEEITYNDLNDSTQDLSKLYKVLLFPGGWAVWYNYWISLTGKERIRSFVQNGGGYFGICAGAFFAADTNVWRGQSYDDNHFTNAYGELTGFDLDLFSGTATGPIDGIAPYPAYDMTIINFPNETDILSSYKEAPFSEAILYYGGPYFTSNPGANMEILGNYEYNGEPALIACTYGSGRIVLTGPHPEIEEDSDRDCVTIDGEEQMDDQGSDWDLVRHLFNWLTSGAPQPSCPELYAWDGSGYRFVGSIFTRMHCPEAERYQPQPVTFPPVPQDDGTLTFLIKEVDREQSYINSTEMCYKYQWDTSDQWVPLPILLAMHNRTGDDVIPALGAKDDLRVFMKPGDEIMLRYSVPPYGLEGIDFRLVSSGYYIWTDETWCKVLATGPDVVVEPNATLTLGALINNMGSKPMSDETMVWFTLEDGFETKVGPVSAAGLAPGSSQLYLFEWTVPDGVTKGTYAYQVSIFLGDTDITWNDEYYGKPDLTDESGEPVSYVCH